MRFSAWIAKQPPGTKARIQRETGLSKRNIADLVAETYKTASFRTASLVVPYTDGAVTIEEMCSPKPAPKAKRKRRAS